MIAYQNHLDGVSSEVLDGFFEDWPSRPTTDDFLGILQGSQHVWLARDGDMVVGFINALSDGSFSAFIPLLEVLPEYQGRGIGRELARRMIETLQGHYSIDLVCDANLVPFYEKLGMASVSGMVIRNRSRIA